MSAEKSGARRIPRGGLNVPSKASRNELSRPMRRCEACGDGVVTCGRHKQEGK